MGGGGADYIVIGAYKGSLDGSKLVARSGLIPQGYKSIKQFWAYAQINGKNWGLTDWNYVRFLQMMFLSEYGSTNIKDLLGYGLTGNTRIDSQLGSHLTGGTKSLGDFIGTLDSDISLPNSVEINFLGVENPYGAWYGEFIQGIYCGSSNNPEQDGTEVFIYEGNRLPTDNELKTHPSSNFRQITTINSTGYYISKMVLGEYFDLIPSEVNSEKGGSSYWCNSVNNAKNQQIFALNDSFNVKGIFSIFSGGNFDSTWGSMGARLAYYGDIQFVPSNAIE